MAISTMNFTTWNITEKDSFFIHSFGNIEEHILYNLCCCILILVTLAGNSLVIVMILTSKSLRTVFNLLILNMAAADLLLGLAALLFYGIFIYSMYISSRNRFVFEEVFDSIVCQFTIGATDIFCKVSVFSVAVISLERYLAIKHPLRHKNYITKRKTLVIIVFLWVMSVLFSIPIIVYIVEAFKNASTVGNQALSCHQLAISNGMPSKLILALELTVGYIIPMFIIVSTTYKIIQILWRPEAAREGTNLAVLKSRRQVTKLIVSVVVAFNVFWLPWAIWLVMVLTGLITAINNDEKILYIVLLIQFANTCANPVLYSIQSRNFRRRLVKMLWRENYCKRCRH